MNDPVRPRRRPVVPGPLALAGVLVGVQGVGLVVLGLVGLVDVLPSGGGVGVGVALFFAAYGVVLLACARALLQRQAWARGPVMITQLIQLGIAWNTRDHLLLALPLAVTALLVLGAMVQSSTIEALLGDDEETGA